MKYLKLIAIALALILALIGINALQKCSRNEGNDITNDVPYRIDERKKRINELCDSPKLSKSAYISAEYGISDDRAIRNLSANEEEALIEYLFAQSCHALETQSETFCMQPSYPKEEEYRLKDLLSFLQQKEINKPNSEKNASLARTWVLFKEYDSVRNLLRYNPSVKYTKPLKEFDDAVYYLPSVSDRKKHIKSLNYYNKCFSKSDYVQKGLESLFNVKKDAMRLYYERLEKVIEQHYSKEPLEKEQLRRMRDDYNWFRENSTSSVANQKFKAFIDTEENRLKNI